MPGAVACALEGTVLSGAVPRSLAGDLRFRGYGALAAKSTSRLTWFT